jgi:hypothetical protein
MKYIGIDPVYSFIGEAPSVTADFLCGKFAEASQLTMFTFSARYHCYLFCFFTPVLAYKTRDSSIKQIITLPSQE